jgi:hypothetical protein
MRQRRLLESGAMRLLRHGRQGEEVMLPDARAEQFFAEVSLDSARYHCDAVPVTVQGVRERRLCRTQIETLKVRKGSRWNGHRPFFRCEPSARRRCVVGLVCQSGNSTTTPCRTEVPRCMPRRMDWM